MSDVQMVMQIAAIGVGASVVMDVWTLTLRKLWRIPSLNYCLVGRWLCLIPGGTWRHQSIGKAAAQRWECPVGWVAHFLIGVLFAAALLAVEGRQWLNQPELLPALAVGVGTVVFPWFVMQPALGMGIAAAKSPAPWRARCKSLLTHTVFGLGLYLSGALLNWL